MQELEEETGAESSYSVQASGMQVGSSSAIEASSSKRSAASTAPSRRRLPNFHIGSYESALAAAKEQIAPLCVILISSEHDDTPAFKRRTLVDPDLVSTLDSKGVIVWGGDVKYRDPYQGSWTSDHANLPACSLKNFATNSGADTGSDDLPVHRFHLPTTSSIDSRQQLIGLT